jgi:hypothetical protein
VAALQSILQSNFFSIQQLPWALSRYSDRYYSLISTNFHWQTPFSSVADTLAGWGLTSSNMTFIRHEMRALLFQYIDRGDATVEYEE